MRRLFAISLACSLAPGLAGQEAARYDLGSLLYPSAVASDAVATDGPPLKLPIDLPLGALMYYGYADLPWGLAQLTGYPFADLDEGFIEGLIDRFGASPGDDPESVFHQHVLLLKASPDTHARTRGLLAMLEQALHGMIELDVHRLPAGIQAGRAVLDAEQTEAFLRRHPPVETLSRSLTADVPDLLQSGRSTDVLLRYETESTLPLPPVAAPVLRPVFDGLQLGAAASPLADGRILLLLGLRETELQRPVAERVVGGSVFGRIQQPEIEVRISATAAVLPAGGSVLLGDERNGAWLLRVRASPPDPGPGDLELVPLGDLLHSSFSRFIDPVPLTWIEPEQLFDVLPPRSRSRALIDLLEGEVHPDTADNAVVGNLLLLRGPEEYRRRFREAVRRLTPDVRVLSIEYATGRTPQADASRHLRGDLSADALSRLLPDRGVLAAVPGYAFRRVDGVETTFLADYEAGISMGSTTFPCLDVETLFSGITLQGMVARGPAGTLSCTGTFTFTADPELNTMDVGIPFLGALDAAEITSVRDDFSVMLDPGGSWHVVQLQPLHGTGDAVALLLRVR